MPEGEGVFVSLSIKLPFFYTRGLHLRLFPVLDHRRFGVSKIRRALYKIIIIINFIVPILTRSNSEVVEKGESTPGDTYSILKSACILIECNSGCKVCL